MPTASITLYYQHNPYSLDLAANGSEPELIGGHAR